MLRPPEVNGGRAALLMRCDREAEQRETFWAGILGGDK